MDATKNSWRVATEQRRAALEALGIHMPLCLSGEPEDCGAGDIEHFSAYTATLMAQTQWDMAVMERACPGQGTGYFVTEMFAEQCHELVPEGFDCEDLRLREQFDMLAEAVEDEDDLSACPYYQHRNEPDVANLGFECGSCVIEPACVTDEPQGGWPATRG